MPNCGALGCTNRSITHPEKSFHRLLSLFKKKNERLVDGENYFQKNYLFAQATLNLNVIKGFSR